MGLKEAKENLSYNVIVFKGQQLVTREVEKRGTIRFTKTKLYED